MTMAIKWFHAVNDHAKLAVALEAMCSVDADEVVGIECDLRCLEPGSDDCVWLSHDPIQVVVEQHALMSAAELIEGVKNVLETVAVSCQCVLKLDFKTEAAISRFAKHAKTSSLLSAIRSLYPRLAVWGNADLFRCHHTDAVTFTSAFPNPVDACVALYEMADVVSIGFHRPASAMVPYGVDDGEAISTFVRQLTPALAKGGEVLSQRRVGITLALRLSLGRNGGQPSVAAIRSMLTAVESVMLGQSAKKRPFVTFWRGRDEVITDGDVEWVLNDLSVPATIDFE